MDVLATAEQLKNELDALRPLDAEGEARIMQKFRLDWNYHSNNLEGNSLTYGETKALILFGITAQGKPLKDHFEITGHNQALNWIIELVKDETELTEVFIRQLHQLLLKESYEVEAQTQNGKTTKRRIEVGKYKTKPNHVITQTGETFYFAAPEETPAKMQELVEWFRKEKENPDTNPIILAALFHYKFIRIHPFDDGNGRVARVLMNFILMQYGFPPVIIKTGDKENYFSVLQQADAGIFEPFIEYIADNLVRSLELMIKGAKGESIEEPDDLDKELTLIEHRLKAPNNEAILTRNREVLLEVFDKSLTPFTLEFIAICEKFDRFYTGYDFSISLDGSSSNGKHTAIDETRRKIAENSLGNSKDIFIAYKHLAFVQEGFGNFDFRKVIFIKFATTTYNIRTADNKLNLVKMYSQFLSKDEIKEFCLYVSKEHKSFIEDKIKERGI